MLAAAVGLLVFVGAACGGPGTAAPRIPDSGAGATPGWHTAAAGPAIRREDALAILPMERDGFGLRPVAAVGGRVLVNVAPLDQQQPEAPERFALWDPASGATADAWTGQAGRQEIVTGTDGDLVVSVRTGFELPFADWEIVLRRMGTPEQRVVARADPEVARAAGVEPSLPLGLAPAPSVAGGRIAWAEYRMGADGRAHRQVHVRSITEGTDLVVADVVAGPGQSLDSPTLGGQRAAWVARDGERETLVVRELASDLERRIPRPGRPFMAALSGDGQFLAWDERMTAKYAMDLASGEVVRFATDEGWGVLVSGSRFAWAPAAAYGGSGGYFDARTGLVRLLQAGAGHGNVAQAMGPWFVWQEPAGAGGAGGYAFMKIGEE